MEIEANFEVVFRGHAMTVVPREGTNGPLRVLLPRQTGEKVPLGLPVGEPVQRHHGILEFHGPCVVNGVTLLGGGYRVLDGTDVVIGRQTEDARFGLDRTATGALAGLVDFAEILGADECELDMGLFSEELDRAKLTARILVPPQDADIRAGDGDTNEWQLSMGAGKSVTVPLVNEAVMKYRDRRESLNITFDDGKEFTVESVGGQSVRIVVSHLCGLLPGTCADYSMDADPDFRGYYDLLSESYGQKLLAKGIASADDLPYPEVSVKNMRPLPCAEVSAAAPAGLD